MSLNDRAASAPPHSAAARRASWHRLSVITLLGFVSGLPLALTGQAMQAWLSVEGVGLATIGLLSLVGLPYTFKFLWAPLMDRFELPWLGRRRGWLVLTQLMLAGGLWWLSFLSPTESIRSFALLAVLIAFVSASQDVVIDAYRTDLVPAPERGLSSSFSVFGYRLAMLVSGGLAMIWADPLQGGGMTWPEIYRLMAWLMLGAAALSATALPSLRQYATPQSNAQNDLSGFFAVLLAVVVGYGFTAGLGESATRALARVFGERGGLTSLLAEGVARPLMESLLSPALVTTTLSPSLQAKWIDLAALLLGMGFTVPLVIWAARRARFETLLNGLRNYFERPQAIGFLAFIVFYKLGDAFAGSLMTPFLLKGMAYSQAEVGVANKLIGLWLTIGGALLGGALMLKLGLWRALMLFGLLQMASNLGFWWLAEHGQGALPSLTIPAFDWYLVKLAQPTRVDGGLLMVIAFENLSGGMGTAAFVAFLMSLCNQRFTATQYALLSAFASVGRVWVGPLAGVMAETIGWPRFFVVSTLAALPALALLWWLRQPVRALEVDPHAPLADD